jgi:chromate transport protein ChrA
MSFPHSREHHARHRQLTLFMLWFWVTQVALWTVLLIAAFVVPSVHALFQKVYWVSILSLYANLTTVASIVAGLWAALAAGSAHEDAEITRAQVEVDMGQIDTDLRHLADLQPGVEAHQLARRIGERLKGQS